MKLFEKQQLLKLIKSKWINYSLLIVVLYFVWALLSEQLGKVQISALNISAPFLILSVFFEIFTRCFIGLTYDQILKGFNSPLPLKVTVSIAWVSFLGKYLPGKVALVASAIYLLKKHNIRVDVACMVPVLYTLMTIFIAAVLSIPLFFFSSSVLMLEPFVIYLLLFLFICCFIIIFKIDWLITMGVNLFTHFGFIVTPVHFSNKQIFICLLLVFLQCFFAGISTWLVSRSFLCLDLSFLGWFISITAFSGVMGLISFFSPAGIGVRDGLYFLFIGQIVGPQNAGVITIFLRLLQTLADVGSAGIGLIYLNYNKNRKGLYKND